MALRPALSSWYLKYEYVLWANIITPWLPEDGKRGPGASRSAELVFSGKSRRLRTRRRIVTDGRIWGRLLTRKMSAKKKIYIITLIR